MCLFRGVYSLVSCICIAGCSDVFTRRLYSGVRGRKVGDGRRGKSISGHGSVDYLDVRIPPHSYATPRCRYNVFPGTCIQVHLQMDTVM